MAQSAYSPDLAPNDFFLFGYLKQKLQRVHIPDRERLKSEKIQIFADIGPDVIISVFGDWIKRREWVVQNGEEYYRAVKMFVSSVCLVEYSCFSFSFLFICRGVHPCARPLIWPV
jgi:hypothetical protein